VWGCCATCHMARWGRAGEGKGAAVGSSGVRGGVSSVHEYKLAEGCVQGRCVGRLQSSAASSAADEVWSCLAPLLHPQSPLFGGGGSRRLMFCAVASAVCMNTS
jgi:hypothetical protein